MKHRLIPVHGNLGCTTTQKSLSPGQGGDRWHGTHRTPGIDVRSKTTHRRIPLHAHLEELKQRYVLPDELLCEPRRLGRRVRGGFGSEEVRPLIFVTPCMILEFQADIVASVESSRGARRHEQGNARRCVGGVHRSRAIAI